MFDCLWQASSSHAKAAVTCLLLLCGAAAHADPNAGKRPSVVSINLCADQLVLLLADPAQIKSLSNLSLESAGSYLYREAAEFPHNRGTAEEVVPSSPDVVIAGQFTNSYTINLLRETGIRVEILPIAESLQAAMDNIALVAGWIKQIERGKQLLVNMQQRLDSIASVHADVNQPLAAIYDPNGYTAGAQSLRGEALVLAGWKNAASRMGIGAYGVLPLETMVGLAPDAVIDSPFSANTFSRGQQLTSHPALRASGLAPKVISIPSNMTICAGPWTLDVIEKLQAERLNLP